jgi:oligoribonuclease NrnB/cAMP/cGMP phosphodiesterase (DHH superfamily)
MTDLKVREERNAKILIAYHAHCNDGFTAAWACRKGLLDTYDTEPSNITLLAVEYGKLEEVADDATLYDAIYFVDFSIPIDILTLITTATQVVIIDHHKTALEMYEGWEASTLGVELVLDLEECGASLVWKYFFPEEAMPTLIKYVQDRDLWQHKLSCTKALNMYINMQPKTIANWDRLYDTFATSHKLDVAVNLGDAVLAYHNKLVAEFVDQWEHCDINGKSGLVVNCPGQFAPDVGQKLQELSGTYGATWFQQGDGKVKWSLRSTGDYDVSELAAKFDGGGHKNAAGFCLKAPRESVEQLGITLWAK